MPLARYLKDTKTVMINCPACGPHYLNTDPDKWYDEPNKKKMPCWAFNGNMDSPTFNPSLLVRTGTYVNPDMNGVPEGDRQWFQEHSVICHSFIRDGKIQFLGDCTHHLKGQTVLLLNIES